MLGMVPDRRRARSTPVCYCFNVVNIQRDASQNSSALKCHREVPPPQLLSRVSFSSSELMERSIWLSLTATSVLYQALC